MVTYAEGGTLTIEDETTRTNGQQARGDRTHASREGVSDAPFESSQASPKSLTAGSYPYWFMLPAGLVFTVLFIVPTAIAFYFSLTRWTLFDSEFIGLDNFRQFFDEPSLTRALRNTIIFAVVTSGSKVVLGMAFAVLLTGPILGRGLLRSVVFFPVLVSTIGVGLTFEALMDPFDGAINGAIGLVRHRRTRMAHRSELRAAVGGDGRRLAWRRTRDRHLHGRDLEHPDRVLRGRAGGRSDRVATLPVHHVADGEARHRHRRHPVAHRRAALVRPHLGDDTGGPGFTSDVMASVIYKQYQAGFYGLSTAGNVVLFILVSVIVVPLFWFLNRNDPRA